MENDLESQEGEWALHPKHHERVIVHIDIDCFYAQVEMVRNPELRNKPMGVKQKYLMVTSNYIARAMGVKKQMYVTEALKFLPELILIDGSDLTPYRQCSNEISSIAQTFTPHVERMGLDENFLDITDKVIDCCDSYGSDIVGHLYGDKDTSLVSQNDPCGCGCFRRLVVGSQIASDLRKKIFESTGVTCCAGIAHNKVVAKMVSGYHKPNQQTIIFPWQVCDLMGSMDHVKCIPGIGNVTTKALEELNISSVESLQRSDVKILRTKFDEDTCRKLKNLAFGRDEGLVKGSVRPQSLGIEDAFTVTKVTSFEIIKSKYEVLLERLLKLLAIDGRRAASLKVVVRKSDGVVKFGPRESKQVPLPPSLFSKGVSDVSETCKTTLFSMTMSAFHKMVDISKPFCLTLIGLSFTKLIDQASESQSIAHFFNKKHCHHEKESHGVYKDQERDDGAMPLKDTTSISALTKKSKASSAGSDRMLDHDSNITRNMSSDCNDSADMLNQQSGKYVVAHEFTDSKDLSNSNEPNSLNSSKSGTSTNLSSPESSFVVPGDFDSDVFDSLPKDIQEEVLSNYKVNYSSVKAIESPKSFETGHCSHRKAKGKVLNTSLDRYFTPFLKQASNKCDSVSAVKDEISKSSFNANDTIASVAVPSARISAIEKGRDIEKNCELNILPRSVDREVFRALPEELQKEILDEEKKRKMSSNPGKREDFQPCKKKPDASSPLMKYLKKL